MWRGHLKLRQQRSARQDYGPVRIVDLDLALPLPRLEARAADGRAYGGVFCLVRKHGKPLGVAEFPLGRRGLSPAELAARLLHLVPESSPAHATLRSRAPSGSSEAPFISVIIATRDRARSLAACLDSLFRQSYENFEIVVVDNAPATAETAELVMGRYARTCRVRYVREDRPGLGHAHNRGLADVSAPIAAFTDDDVLVDPQWLTALASDFEADTRVGCVTGLILPAELETRAQYWTERHGGFGKGFARKVYDLDSHRPRGRLFPFTAGQFGSGANMAFRTEALKRCGGFDSALGAGTLARGGDDLASFYRIIRGGYQLVYEPEAIVWHHHRREEAGMRRQAFSYGMGLGAYLTKLIVDRPATALELAAAFPAGLAHMLAPSADKNSRLPKDYPTMLVWRERLGILAGIPGYLRSRAALRRPLKTVGPHRPQSLPAVSS